MIKNLVLAILGFFFPKFRKPLPTSIKSGESAKDGASSFKPRWTHIMIHHSATTDTEHADTASFRDHHVNVRHWRDIGYHLIVERVGSSYQVLIGRPLDQDGAHCPGWNKKALSIVWVGNFNKAKPAEALLAWGIKYALRPMMGIFNIPESKILFHRDHRQTECPGKYLTKALILKALKKY